MKRSLLPWEKSMVDLTKYDWLTAVGLSPQHKTFARDLRVAIIVMQMTDAETDFCWPTQQTLAQLSGFGDVRQVRTALKRLEMSGAIRKKRIADLQPDILDVLGAKMSGNRNKRGAIYKIQKFWALETFEAYAKRQRTEPDHLRKKRELNRTTDSPV